MNDQTPKSAHDEADDSVSEADVLITRLVDHEATAEDRLRFESLATANPQLWRVLALQQQDMNRLAAEVDPYLACMAAVDLPEHMDAARLTDRAQHRSIGPWLVAFAGWAAVFALAVLWIGRSPGNSQVVSPVLPVSGSAESTNLSPDEHLNRYLQAPFVMGELAPTLLQVETLSDGRTAIRFLRRIEEVAFLDPEAEIPVDANGNLTSPPSALRSNVAGPQQPPQ